MNTNERRQAIKQIKNEQNSLTKAIRHMKAARKGGWTRKHHQYALGNLQSTFRHRHVAWSIVKGRQLEAVDSGDELNMKVVDAHVKKFQKRLGHKEDAAA